MKNNFIPKDDLDEKFKDDPFYGFDENERLHIGYYTNVNLTSNTFKTARQLKEENPKLFAETYKLAEPANV